MNGKQAYGNAADMTEATPAVNSDPPGTGPAGSKNNLGEARMTTLIVHLPDGRTITYTRHLPRLPLGL